MKLHRIGSPLSRHERIQVDENWETIEDNFNNVVSVISDEALDKVVDSAKLIWQKPVDTYEDIATTYPNPEEGWTVMARNDSADYDPNDPDDYRKAGTVWRYNGTDWEPVQQIDPTAINEVENRINQRIEDNQQEVEVQLAVKATESELGRVMVDGKSIISIDGTIEVKNHKSPVLTPVGFNWVEHPLKNKIFTDGLGNFSIVDFNIRAFKPKGKIYYVDVNNGSDTNDGLTLNTALQSVRAAYDKSDCTVIKVAEGFYNREQSMWGRTITRDLSIEALAGHDVLLTQMAIANWQPSSGRTGVYQTTSSNVQFILDSKFKDSNGDYSKLTKVSTADEVEANPGSYAQVSGVIYVQTKDSRVVDNETIWRFTDADAIKVEGNYTLYLEGIKMYGGNRPLFASNATGAGSLKVFAKDCDFKYSNGDTYDVVHIRGAELAIFENCSATNGYKDGFNYYSQNGISTNAVEINCVGKFNGVDTDGSDQGSTQHSGGKIIRINGDYNNNYGSNIADDGAGTQSWNMGCVSFESLSPFLSQKKNFYAYTDVDMWLDGCIGFSAGTDGSDIGGSGNVYVRNNNLLSDIQIDTNTNVIEY